ncbi:hypothetical protein [Kribbella sp. CA-247076]|uniref:hypothetical protein n=1 Tax=Kribbella sp. CA-247076 TaxID=3239941 RepID=UPI003D94E18B
MIARGVLVALAVVALTACSSDDGGTAGGAGTVGTAGGEAAATTPFPAAADGQNYAACADGNCEVLVRESATLTVEGLPIAVTVVDGKVRLTGKHANGSAFDVSASGNGVAGWGSGDRSHTLALKAADGSTAILILRTSR